MSAAGLWRQGEKDSPAAPAPVARWCRPAHVQFWSARRSSLTVSASSSCPPLGSRRSPSSSTRSSVVTLSMRMAAPSRDTSTSPAVISDCPRSDFGITKRQALSMVVRIPLAYRPPGITLYNLIVYLGPHSHASVPVFGRCPTLADSIPSQGNPGATALERAGGRIFRRGRRRLAPGPGPVPHMRQSLESSVGHRCPVRKAAAPH